MFLYLLFLLFFFVPLATPACCCESGNDVKNTRNTHSHTHTVKRCRRPMKRNQMGRAARTTAATQKNKPKRCKIFLVLSSTRTLVVVQLSHTRCWFNKFTHPGCRLHLVSFFTFSCLLSVDENNKRDKTTTCKLQTVFFLNDTPLHYTRTFTEREKQQRQRRRKRSRNKKYPQPHSE